MSYEGEKANKLGYLDIQQDEKIKTLLESLAYKNEEFLDPKKQRDIIGKQSKQISYGNFGSVTKVLCVDGGYSVVDIGPGTSIAYLKIGSATVDLEVVNRVNKARFVLPEDIDEMKEEDVFSLALPLTNFTSKEGTDALQYAFFYFLEEYDLHKTLETLLENSWDEIKKTFSKFFTGVVGTSERDIEGNIGTIMTMIEQLFLFKKIISHKEQGVVDKYLYIKDGSLSFGKFRGIFEGKIEAFIEKNGLTNLIGMEKSGVLKKYLTQNREYLEKDNYILFSQNFITTQLGLPNYTNNFYGKKLGMKSDPHLFILNYADPKTTHEDIERISTILKFVKSYSYQDSILATIFVNSAVSLSEEGKENLRKFTLEVI